MFDGDAHVEQAVVLALEHAADAGRDIHPFEHHGDDDRRLGGKAVHAEPLGRPGQSGLELRIVHRDEVPRLRIAGRRGEARRLDAAHDQLARHGPLLIAAVALAFAYKF